MNYKSKLPCSPEAEQAILGAILQSGVHDGGLAFEFVIESGLKPDHFFNKQYREFYQAFLSLKERSISINTMTFAESAEARRFDGMGLSDLLVSFVDNLQFSPTNEKALKETVDILIEKHQRRSLILHYRDQEQYIFDPETETAIALSKYEAALSGFDVTTAEVTDIKPVADSITGTFNLIESRLEGNDQAFLPTSWIDFNNRFGGIPQGLTVFAGRPAMGKSAAALTLALESAKKGKQVLFFSLEMPTDQLNTRLLSMVSGLDCSKLMQPKPRDFTPEFLERLIQATDYLASLPLYIEDDATTVEQIISKTQAWARRFGTEPDLVIVDYLQIVETDQFFKDDYSRTTHLSKKLRAFSVNFRVTPSSPKTPIRLICLAQLSRAVEARTNKRPMMSDLRESGQIEQDASLIVMLYRDEYYNPNTPDIGIAEMIVTKNRNAPTGTIKALYQAEITTFLNLAS